MNGPRSAARGQLVEQRSAGRANRAGLCCGSDSDLKYFNRSIPVMVSHLGQQADCSR